MIIRANNKEINVNAVFSTQIHKNGKQFPALKFVFDGGVSNADVVNLISGDIVIDNILHEGYTTLGDISVVVGKITTAEDELMTTKEVLGVLTGNAEISKESAMEQRDIMKDAVQSLPDDKALVMISYYPTWEECMAKGSVEYDKPGFKFTYDGVLYSCVNANPTFQADWIPGQGTGALYVVINETNSGELDDPIPASVGMEYTYGLYYKDPSDEKIYKCARVGETDGNTVVLQFIPSQLVGQYFELAQ
jgi:hypothetical protein